MSNIGSYEERAKTYDLKQVKKELGYKEGQSLNIGWMCTDRICKLGLADKTALIWESTDGHVRRFSYNDIRLLSNAFAAGLKDMGIVPGDRVCMFMDKIPELYIGMMGILKLGAVAQPLFSAFMSDSLLTRLADAETRAIFTTKRHVKKVRKILGELPKLERVIVLDADEAHELGEREVIGADGLVRRLESDRQRHRYGSCPRTAGPTLPRKRQLDQCVACATQFRSDRTSRRG